MAKSKWKDVEEKILMVEAWAREGLADEEIARKLGIGKTAFYKYKKEHLELANTLKRGRDTMEFQVENALLKRALGYEYTEITKERVVKKDDNGKVLIDENGLPCCEIVITKIVKKEVTPDTKAQIFWLKNKNPDKWNDKQDIEHAGNITLNNPYKDLSIEELKKLAALGDESE